MFARIRWPETNGAPVCPICGGDAVYNVRRPNGAESFFSRLRRAEQGHHHHISGPYLLKYAQESAWREDNRRMSNGDQTQNAVALALSSKPSVDFCGYWQRHKDVIKEG